MAARAPKKVLFVSQNFPEDPGTSVHGIFQRMNMFVEAVAGLCDTLEMLFFVRKTVMNSLADLERTQASLREYWNRPVRLHLVPYDDQPISKSIWSYYVQPAFRVRYQEPFRHLFGAGTLARAREILDGRPSWLFAHRLHALLPLLALDRPIPPYFLDLDDIEHKYAVRDIQAPPRWPGKLLRYAQLPALMAAERAAIRGSQRTFVCSNGDREYLRRIYRTRRVDTVANSVVVPPAGVEQPDSRTVLFVGTFAYRPNAQAADFLLSEVWPRVTREMRDARLVLAGRDPDRLARYASAPAGVIFAGFVTDLGALYSNCAVVCCPILSGAGTRVKIVEAAAHGKAIVSTSLGAEGLDFTDGREIMIRDGAERIASACLQLLADPGHRARLGSAAHAKAIANYDRAAIIDQVRSRIREGFQPPGYPAPS